MKKAEKRPRFSPKEMTMLAMLIALNVIMAEVLKFPIVPKAIELSFGFVPIAVAGMRYGRMSAITVAVVADIIGALIFNAGIFHFGFTLTALCTGAFYGFFLHKPALTRGKQIQSCILAQLCVSFSCFALLNSFWVATSFGVPFGEYFTTRFIVNLVAFPVYTFVLYLIGCKRKVLSQFVK